MNKLGPARGIRWVGSRRSGYTSDLDDDLADSGAPASKVLEQPSPVMPNPFRPDARPTYFSTSMRSPMFSSTSARPGAMSIEAQYANQVPLERQGPIEMTTGKQIFGGPTMGLKSNIPAQYLQPKTHEGSYLRGATLKPAAGPFAPRRSGVAMPSNYVSSGNHADYWPLMDDAEQRRWIERHPASGSTSTADDVALPAWAVGTYSQRQWTEMGPERRAAVVTAHVETTTPGIGTQILQTLLQGGTMAIGAYQQYNQAERDAAVRLAQEEGQRRLQELIAQNGRNSSDPAVQAQMAQLTTALATLGQRINAPSEKKEGPSTALVVGLVVGGVVLLGGMVILATRSGDRRGPRDNPGRKARKARKGRKGG